MDNNMETLKLVLDYATSMLWPMCKGLLLGVVLGLLLSFILYFGVTRLGWVDIRGQKKKWARIIYGIVVFLTFLIAIPIAGVVTGSRDGVCEIVTDVANKHQFTKAIGGIFLIPVVMSHAIIEENIQNPDIEELWKNAAKHSDVSFLLNPDAKKKAFDKISYNFIKFTIQKIKLDKEVLENQKLQEDKIGRWLIVILEWFIEKIAVKFAEEKVALYESLFEGLTADADGNLSYLSASNKVGGIFFQKRIIPLVQSPFNGFRLQIILIALGIWIVGILLIQLIGRWLDSRQKRLNPPATSN